MGSVFLKRVEKDLVFVVACVDGDAVVVGGLEFDGTLVGGGSGGLATINPNCLF